MFPQLSTSIGDQSYMGLILNRRESERKKLEHCGHRDGGRVHDPSTHVIPDVLSEGKTPFDEPTEKLIARPSSHRRHVPCDLAVKVPS